MKCRTRGGRKMESQASGPGRDDAPSPGRSDAERDPSHRQRGRPRRTHVEPQQLIALAHLFAGKTKREAAELVGVDEKTVGRWLQEPAVRHVFTSGLEVMATELWTRMAAEATEVWEVFRDLLRSTDDRIRLRACIFYLERVLSVLPIERLIEERRLEMTPMPPALSRLLEESTEGDGGEAA
jgi:hypothetical protein